MASAPVGGSCSGGARRRLLRRELFLPRDRVRLRRGRRACQQDLPLGAVEPPLRRLARAGAPDPLERVGVRVVDRDESVVIIVRCARADPVHQCTGEHRAPRSVLAMQRLALEGVLGPPRRGEHHSPPPFTDQPLADPEVGVALGALRKGTAEAAVQDHHLLARPAVFELVEHPARLDPRGREPILDRVPRREVEPPTQVDHAVAGQVDEEQVIRATVGEEVLDRQPDLLRLLVDHRGHRKTPDLGIGQDVTQVCRVPSRRTQPPKGRVDVIGDSDHQRRPTAAELLARSCVRHGRSGHRRPSLPVRCQRTEGSSARRYTALRKPAPLVAPCLS